MKLNQENANRMISSTALRMFQATELGYGVHSQIGLVRGLIMTDYLVCWPAVRRTWYRFSPAFMLSAVPNRPVRGERGAA